MFKEVNGRWGPCRYFGKDEYVGRSMHSYGEYGPDETEMIVSLAGERCFTRDILCLDIGANIGCISQALDHAGFGVIAFEPQPELFELLSFNHKGCNINMALGSEAGIAKMPKVYYSDKGNFGGLGLHEKSLYGTIDVEVGVLDDVLPTRGVGFIKIDVEGYELEVLKGASGLIRRNRPIMYIEDDRTEKSNALRAYINSLGYSITEHRPTLYREQNFFRLKKNIWSMNYASHNLICRPC
jgi:FkbM family methyltransferase